MKKITMQEIADALNISRVTVWKVINNYSGVSEVLKEQILSKANEMGYNKNNNEPVSQNAPSIKTTISSKNEPTTVSVVVSRPESSVFWMNIIHQIAKELDKNNINLMYTYLPSKLTEGYTLPKVLTNETVQGIIVLNVYDYELLSVLNQLKIPKVFLDMVTSMPIDTLTGDLFLLEGKSSIQQITNTIIKKGRTEIGFIGDIEYAKTNQDRYKGFLAAMEQSKLSVNKNYCLTKNIGIYTYAEEINDFLSNLKKMPEAFVCASDYVASFLLQYLNEHNYRVPEDVAVSGYDGSTEYPYLVGSLTTVHVKTRDLGKRLANQLIYKINSPDSPLEVTYVHSNIIYADSTNF